ncbi:MAG: TIGR04168 family protein [Planctomycetes bacterium]|nr:TIGR04168 family protein [Planctomycetota bacterium]
MTPPRPATLYALGDLHKHWRPEDAAFLEREAPAHVLFVGDLGDEDVELVRELAAIRVPKAFVLGNHDAWQSFTWKRPTPRLMDSLQALDADHIGYEVRDLPEAGISILGARPFSWGGPGLRSPELYDTLYGVKDMARSAAKIVEAAQRAAHQDLLILAHNGPTGLGAGTGDIYGKDFGREPGGDWGDPDLEEAIARIRDQGFRVRAVVAGHMHHRLAHPRGELRTRYVRRDGVAYVNPAIVPRLRRAEDGTVHAFFLRMRWSAGRMVALEEVWVDLYGTVVEVHRPETVETGS